MWSSPASRRRSSTSASERIKARDGSSIGAEGCGACQRHLESPISKPHRVLRSLFERSLAAQIHSWDPTFASKT